MEDGNGSFTSIQKPVDSLSAAYCQDIRPFIDVIDNLRRFGLQQDINLPNVVVVGDQSSGKSSIIEAISGIQLPRGKGIVTRCPLELQLKRVVDKPWKATLTYKSLKGVNEKVEINESVAVEKNIREAQENMCSSSKGVSRELITLRVESPAESAPDLTLIDLPGIARIAMEGQPSNICGQIKKMIREHVDNENTVILCVVSANLDAAVNESIQVAKTVDPHGIRTFGVITKPDTADEAQKEEVICLLNNQKIRLEKGFHMVKCRSQKELDENLSLEESLNNETEYFQNDKYYKTASKSLLGTMNLALKITEQLVQVIQNNLPGLRDKISFSLQESQEKLMGLPQGVPESSQEKLMYLISVIGDMNNEIKSSLIKGKSNLEEDNLFYVWRKNFNKLRFKIDSIKTRAMSNRFTINKLKEEILKQRGNEISGFLNFELFETLIISHVLLYKTEAESILTKMKKHTELVLHKIIEKYFEHLPMIASNLKQIEYNELEFAGNKTLERIKIIFEEEKLVFTLDDAFEKEMEIIKNEEEDEKLNNKNTNQESLKDENLKKNTKRMLAIIECYLKIVHSRLCDTIPMSIRQCLHVELSMNLQRKFIEYAMSAGVEAKVTENKKVNEDRENLKNKIDRLQLARVELSKL